jgi:cytochrome c oxidase assembly factor CtaG
MFGNGFALTLADLIPMLIFVVLFVFWGFMVRDMFENPEIPQDQRLIWILCFLFFSFPTAIFYYFTRYNSRH